MSIIIHTDASSKNGYSCWVYKSSIDEKCVCGILHTMNSAAAETIAAIKAIERAPEGVPLFIISDSLITVNIIQQHGTNYKYPMTARKFFREARDKLRRELYKRPFGTVDSIWINSKNTNEVHIEVDNTAKIILDNYLKYRGLL